MRKNQPPIAPHDPEQEAKFAVKLSEWSERILKRYNLEPYVAEPEQTTDQYDLIVEQELSFIKGQDYEAATHGQ